MAAIFYGTRFSNAAGDSVGLPIKKLWHETRYNTGEWANHVYVQLFGKNTEFKVGQIVTIQTPTDTFSGQIWYIYNSTEVYNIYIHPSTKASSEIQDATSGTAWLGAQVPTSVSPTVTALSSVVPVSVAPAPIVPVSVAPTPIAPVSVAPAPVVPVTVAPTTSNWIAPVSVVSTPAPTAPAATVVPQVSTTVTTPSTTDLKPIPTTLDPVTTLPVAVKPGMTALQTLQEEDTNGTLAEKNQAQPDVTGTNTGIKKINPLTIILVVLGVIMIWKIKNK